MTRSQVIRTLFLGGQTAIFIELVVVFGAIFLVLTQPFMGDYRSIESKAAYDTFETTYDIVNESPFVWSLSIVLTVIVPTGAMLIVVWAWHLYFASEHIQLMNWVATSIALVGVAFNLMLGGFTLTATPFIRQAIDAGDIAFQDAYIGFVLFNAIGMMGIATLYAFYPLLLVVASYEKRLLPVWFMVIAIAIATFNDVAIFFVAEYPRLADGMDIVRVFWPFLMGVVMLRKAQQLANDQYKTTTP